MFEGKVGEGYTKAKLEEIHKDLETRYQQSIPPGFRDAKKENSKQNDEDITADKFGDGVLWFQIIDHAKVQQKPIIFITDDVKDDWWRRDRGKTRGPRPELIEEIYKNAGVSFYMYTPDTFIKRAQEFLNVQVQPTTIEEVRELRQQGEVVQREVQEVSSTRNRYRGGGIALDILRQAQMAAQISRNVGGLSVLADAAKQAQQTQRIINSMGGISAVTRFAEEARQLQQINNNLLDIIRPLSLTSTIDQTSSEVNDDEVSQSNDDDEASQLDDNDEE